MSISTVIRALIRQIGKQGPLRLMRSLSKSSENSKPGSCGAANGKELITHKMTRAIREST